MLFGFRRCKAETCNAGRARAYAPTVPAAGGRRVGNNDTRPAAGVPGGRAPQHAERGTTFPRRRADRRPSWRRSLPGSGDKRDQGGTDLHRGEVDQLGVGGSKHPEQEHSTIAQGCNLSKRRYKALAPGSLRPNVSGPTTARPMRIFSSGKTTTNRMMGTAISGMPLRYRSMAPEIRWLDCNRPDLQRQERKRIGDDEKKQGGQIEYERALKTVVGSRANSVAPHRAASCAVSGGTVPTPCRRSHS